MNFLFNWKNIIGGSDSDGFEDDFPDCISQGEFEDDDNDSVKSVRTPKNRTMPRVLCHLVRASSKMMLKILW